jgi:hypothetical protein
MSSSPETAEAIGVLSLDVSGPHLFRDDCVITESAHGHKPTTCWHWVGADVQFASTFPATLRNCRLQVPG